jgi:hypothetical protein
MYYIEVIFIGQILICDLYFFCDSVQMHSVQHNVCGLSPCCNSDQFIITNAEPVNVQLSNQQHRCWTDGRTTLSLLLLHSKHARPKVVERVDQTDVCAAASTGGGSSGTPSKDDVATAESPSPSPPPPPATPPPTLCRWSQPGDLSHRGQVRLHGRRGREYQGRGCVQTRKRRGRDRRLRVHQDHSRSGCHQDRDRDRV